MATTLVIGAQWGDEGKGKIIDYLSQDHKVIARYNGGANAGHTIKNHLGKFVMHLMPSGVFNPHATLLITNGVIIDPKILVSEISQLEQKGVKLQGRFFISPRCHLVMPYHRLLEQAYENVKGQSKIGTTKRGIGPANADKVSYNGIRIFDLLDKSIFSEKLQTQLLIKNKILVSLGEEPLEKSRVEKEYLEYLKILKPFVKETYPILTKHIQAGDGVLLEGAQGVFLDNDWGTYPYVTGASIVSGSITAQAGLPPSGQYRILGVTKAYSTRVGNGPFPTELTGEDGEKLRTGGSEFGATTGRPRRCGWLDLELLRFATKINGFSEVAMTKIDVLDNFKEIKVCVGYKLDGKNKTYPEMDSVMLDNAKPVYKTFKGWGKSTKKITDYKKLPAEAKAYLSFLEKEVGVPISFISTGPERKDTIKI